MIRLYWNIGSQPARAVKALLDIGKIKHECVVMNLIQNQTRTPEYLKRNPLGQVPFIQTSDQLGIGQSNAIMIYLCKKFPSTLSAYYGTTLEEEAKVNEMLSWYQGFYRPALFGIIALKIYGVKKQGIPFSELQLQKATKDNIKGIQFLESLFQRSGSPYLCGQSPSIADILAYFETTNLICYGLMEELDKVRLVSAWYERMGKIPQISHIQEQWAKTANNFAELLNSIKPSPQPKL